MNSNNKLPQDREDIPEQERPSVVEIENLNKKQSKEGDGETEKRPFRMILILAKPMNKEIAILDSNSSQVNKQKELARKEEAIINHKEKSLHFKSKNFIKVSKVELVDNVLFAELVAVGSRSNQKEGKVTVSALREFHQDLLLDYFIENHLNAAECFSIDDSSTT